MVGSSISLPSHRPPSSSLGIHLKHPLHDLTSRLARRTCIFTLFVGAIACDHTDKQRGCSASSKEPPTIVMETTLPRRAEAIIFASRLDQLFESTSNLSNVMPRNALATASLCSQATQVFTLPLCQREGWETLGARFDAPAVLVVDDKEVSIRVTTSDPRALSSWASKLAESSESLSYIPEDDTSAARIIRRTESGPREILSFMEFKNLAILSIEPGLGLKEERDVPLSSHVFKLANLTPTEQWGTAPKNKALEDKLAPLGPVHGVLRPGAALATLPAANEDAARQRDRLAGQFGALGFATQYLKSEKQLRLHLLLQEDVEEASLIPKLQPVEGALPTTLGSLIEPGILGVLRLSIQPEEFFAMLRLGLPPEQRDEIDALFEKLQTEFALDAREATIGNLSGHVLVILYGLEVTAFEKDPVLFMRDLLMLQATREAIYLPIEDRQKMARFLDAMTQLTRNKLQRQDVDETLQYAWKEDGALSWAIVLHDDYMLLIDSTTAFDHAMRHVRNPKELSPSLTKMGLPRLLEGDRQVGLYLDTSGVLTVLPEDAKEARALLEPVKSIMLHADVADKTRTTRIELDLWLR